jgi:magnesium-transporting ATPase (P-type)
MKNILLVRKTVKWYVYYNLINVVVFSIILNILIFNTPDGINILSGINNESFNQEHMMSVFIIAQIVVITIMILILWLFYYLLYGILLKKLNKNYKELTKLNEIS